MKFDPQGQLDAMFHPKSVAVVGASETLGKWGSGIINSLKTGEPDIEIYPVNPRREEVFGLKTYSDITEIPGEVDLAAIAIPPKAVSRIMESCVKKGVKIAIIITAGFAETGEEGKRLEEEIVKIARQGETIIVGPNCMGHLYTGSNLSTVPFIPEELEEGDISVISQSGIFGVYMVRIGLQRGLKFNKLIASGNEANLHFEDYLEYLGNDPETKIIVGYIEELREGRKFIELASEISKGKPILVIKAGRTKAGSRAAKSHTGAMAGEDSIYDAVFRQSGVIRAETLQELFDTVKALQLQPLPKGKGIGVLTAGGGFGVLAADACEKYGLDMPELSDETLDKLNLVLPLRWSHGNPVDMAATGGAAYNCLPPLLEDEGIDLVFVIYSIGMRSAVLKSARGGGPLLEKLEEEEKSDLKDIITLASKLEKPIISAGITGASQVFSLEDPILGDIPAYPSPERAARVIRNLVRYRSYLGKKSRGAFSK